jgi:PAS domain S-box-containing protein
MAEGNRYAEIFEHAPIARLITDAKGIVSEANRAAAALFGVRHSSLLGGTLVQFVPEDDRQTFEHRLLAAGRTTVPTTWQTSLEPRSGASFTAEIHVVGSRSDAGHLHWAITDVTERMDLQQELRLLTAELEGRVQERTREVEAERARLAAVIDQIPAGLVIIGPDGAVVTANAEARRLLHDDALDVVEGIPAGEGGRAEVIADDGRRIVLELSTAPVVDAEGTHVGAIQLFRDVSARESQERAEREFVTNAAHQLQSPLAAIISATEVLQSGAKDGPERDIFLGHIEREANRLARLARALLVLARAQTGFEAPKDEVVSIAPLLEEIAAATRPVEGVSVEIACDPTIAVITNRELIEQALMNVVENATKYTKQGRITMSARLDGHVAEILVTDTGPGIPDTERPLVLERFYRAASNGAEGFGLGFAIVRSAMEALGGDVDVVSVLGSGTSVTLRLPQPALVVET